MHLLCQLGEETTAAPDSNSSNNGVSPAALAVLLLLLLLLLGLASYLAYVSILCTLEWAMLFLLLLMRDFLAKGCGMGHVVLVDELPRFHSRNA